MAADNAAWDVLVLPMALRAETEDEARAEFLQALIEDNSLIRVQPHAGCVRVTGRGSDAANRQELEIRQNEPLEERECVKAGRPCHDYCPHEFREVKMSESTITVTRQKPKPGDAVIRFGDWRKRQPCVLLDAQQWVTFGKPDEVTVAISARDDDGGAMGPYNDASCLPDTMAGD